MNFTRIADYFEGEHEKMEQHAPDKLALTEPRRIITPGGYDTARMIAPATYQMTQQYRLAKRSSGPPIELSGVAVAYESIRYQVPTFFVSESLARAAAATQLPSDFLLSELHWPMPSIVLGFPVKFMREYAGMDSSYVWCANLAARGYHAPGEINGPIIEPTFAKVSLQYYRLDQASGQPEIFIGSFPLHEAVNDVVRRYAYIDHTKAEDVDTLKERLHLVASLVFKVLLVLNSRSGLIKMGTCVRPRSEKRGRVRDALWSPNFIGESYRTMKMAGSRTGDGAVKVHWRRGHMTWQVVGSKTDFVPVSDMPRDDEGGIVWSSVPGETKEKFLRSHRRQWLDPVLIGDL